MNGFRSRSGLIMQAAALSTAGALLVHCTATQRTSSGGSSGDGGDASSSAASTSGGTGGFGGSLSVGAGGSGGSLPPSCKVADDSGDAVPDCTKKAPANAFSPVVQWTWTAPATGASYPGSVVTPLVANFTDDNKDGSIDLCDIPDIIVVTMDASPAPNQPGSMYMLAGDTGAQELKFAAPVNAFITPALGDIDGDGVPEVVTSDPSGHVVAFKADGSLKWTGDVGAWFSTFNTWCTATALYDLDGDGSVEIIIGFEVFDANGKRKWGFSDLGNVLCATATAADLDGDGKLEVIFGNAAYRYDGTPYFQLANHQGGHPMVANLDADPEPEILLTGVDGITVLEHDGKIKFGPVRPTDPNPSVSCWCKPGAIHDFDGDGVSDAAIGTCTDYSVYSIGVSATPRWSASVFDMSGLATGTAFDFLGDGVADAIYADEHQAYVFDGKTGAQELTTPRESGTFIEYPVVADVDNDGSAEIVVVSNWGWFGAASGPSVTVVKDANDRWIQARRIWNQHAYHVTNVREDGTIPKVPKKSWQRLNTFRTNSQIEGTGDCSPPPPK